MRYFNFLHQSDLDSLFFHFPQPFDKTTKQETLRSAVGGLLYTPGINQNIAQTILTGKIQDLVAMVICLEDSVGDLEREIAIENTKLQLTQLLKALENGSLQQENLPLIFIRVKDVHMLERIADIMVCYSCVLTGVVLPKVTLEGLRQAMSVVSDIHRQAPEPFYAMPILESQELMLCNDRVGLLQGLKSVTDRYFPRILNIRVGATDLCGLYGIRRKVDTPIYSITMVAECIADVVRVFGQEDRYTISGPVWEYYRSVAQANTLNSWNEIDGLLHEVGLDLQNGLCGKTCIHPTQLLPVQACHVVSYEDYQDAITVLEGDSFRVGVLSSVHKNKMNELNPHAFWAEKVLRQARIYGVFQKNINARELLQATLNGAYCT